MGPEAISRTSCGLGLCYWYSLASVSPLPMAVLEELGAPVHENEDKVHTSCSHCGWIMVDAQQG